MGAGSHAGITAAIGYHGCSVFQHSAHPALPVLFSVALTCLSSCTPPAYPPPHQIVMPMAPETSWSPDAERGGSMLLEMSDPTANSAILGGVAPDLSGSEWRFTGAHARFRLQLRTVGSLNFCMRFFLHEESLRSHGPLSFRIGLNGNSFQTYRFTQAGDMEYSKPIPESWIPAPGAVDIALDVDPPWRLPDGTTLGVLLHSIGFQKRGN